MNIERVSGTIIKQKHEMDLWTYIEGELGDQMCGYDGGGC